MPSVIDIAALRRPLEMLCWHFGRGYPCATVTRSATGLARSRDLHRIERIMVVLLGHQWRQVRSRWKGRAVDQWTARDDAWAIQVNLMTTAMTNENEGPLISLPRRFARKLAPDAGHDCLAQPLRTDLAQPLRTDLSLSNPGTSFQGERTNSSHRRAVVSKPNGPTQCMGGPFFTNKLGDDI